MKKLLIYALLLVTGFAFYSCDDRFDNPTSKQQDPSNPNATWTYEVSVKFAEFNMEDLYAYDEEGNRIVYEAPQTLYVFNNELEPLGAIKCAEEIDQDNYAAGYYKFSGKLKGAIGDTLIIGTIEDIKWFMEKQDGSLENILKNGILQIAKAPIIIANETKGTIGTQNVKLQNKTAIQRYWLYRYATGKEKYLKVSFEDFMNPNSSEKTMTITFGKDVVSTSVYVAYPLIEEKDVKYNYESETEEGVKIYQTVYRHLELGKYNGYWYLSMYPKEIDITDYIERFNSTYLSVNIDDMTITQSSEEEIPYFDLDIYAKGTTIKNLNYNGYLYIGLPDKEAEITLTVTGKNTIKNGWRNYILGIWQPTTIKGNGSLNLINTGTWGYGIYIDGYSTVAIDDDNEYAVPASLTIDKGVTVKTKGYWQGTYVANSNIYWIRENGEWKEITDDKTFKQFLSVNGTLESEGNNEGIWKVGDITVGTTGVLKAISGNAGVKIWDANITEGDDYEAKLETLVADKSKFSDVISDDNKTRTIKKK